MKFHDLAHTICTLICVVINPGVTVHVHLNEEQLPNSIIPSAQLVKKSLAGISKPLTVKPHADPRNYQIASLENGLKVINIQDTNSLTSAFAVAVGAASYDNPDEFPGLAHFCEHMLFLGNAKYPEPMAFDKFVSAHGGYSNAFTAAEVTDYFAELSSSASGEGMDRLANFFIHPQFDKQYVSQEVNAVNSEHMKNVKDAPWFVSAIMDSLATPGSPIGKFSTGDINTLYNKPMAKGLNPVDALGKWFQDNYCPGRMRIATFGPEPLEEQLKRVKEDFAELPPGTEQCNKGPNDHHMPSPWPASQLGKWVDIQGTQPQSQLWIFFSMPDITMEYKSSPMQYLNWVFSYGGVNSLSQKLENDMGLTTGLSMMNDGSSIGTSFWLIATLTSEGSQKPGVVLDVIYAYIASMRGQVDTELYNSLADKAKLEWDWTQPGAPSDTVSNFAEMMMRIPLENVLWADTLITEPKPELVQQLLKNLHPTNMNVAFVNINMTKTSGISLADSKLAVFPHYNTTYMVSDLANMYPGARERWSSWLSETTPPQGLEAQLSSVLQSAGINIKSSPIPRVPGPLKGIPKELNTVNMHVAGEFANSDSVNIQLFGPHPQKFDGAAGSRDQLWVRSGWVTTSPEVQIAVSMRILSLPDSPETSAYDLLRMSMYRTLLNTDMEPKLFDLEAAGGSYSVDLSTMGISMSFSGYEPVLPPLMEGAIQGFVAGVNQSNPKVIKKFVQLMAEQNDNLRTYSEMPYSYALADRGLIMQKGIYSNEELLSALAGLNLETTATVARDLVMNRPLTATTLTMGNVQSEEALATVGNIIKSIRSQGARAPVEGDLGSVEHVTPVLNINKPIELRKSSPKAGDENGVAVVTMFTDVADLETRVILNLIGDLIQPVAYGYLRTTKQLGYVVNSGVSMLSNIMYLSTVVQGVAEPADQMEAHIEYVYTKLFPEALANLTDEEFQNYKTSFANTLLEPPTAATEEFSHQWSLASDGGKCFGLTDEMLEYVNELSTKEPIIQFYNNLVFPMAGPRKRFSVKYFAGEVPPRPSKAEMATSWAKAGVTPQGLELLNREYDNTIMLDKADSTIRHKLQLQFPYHPRDIICSRRK